MTLQMRTLITAVAVAMSACSIADAAELDEKRCILAAGEKLPTVPGIVVTASRAEPMSNALGKSKAYNVTIEYDALKQHFMTGYDCLVDGPGAIVKMRGLTE